jgi:hypothetical protein
MDENQTVHHPQDTSPGAEVDRSGTERNFDHNVERPGERSERFREHFREAEREVNGTETETEPDADGTAKARERRQQRRDRKERESIRETVVDAVDETTDTGVQPTEAEAGDRAEQEEPANEAPTSWTREAKSEWAKLSPRIQQEIRKREDDMERGVAQLKQGYQQIDQALAPWHGEMQSFGKTPAEIITQMFAWYSALAQNPDAAVRALLQSYRYPVARLVQAYGPQRLLQEMGFHVRNTSQGTLITRNAQAWQQQNISAQVQQAVAPYIQYVSQQQAQQRQEFEARELATTERYLDDWARDKPHFSELRNLMGTLLTPDGNGKAAVPLKDDGKIDLDGAYLAACKMRDLDPKRSRQEVEEREHAKRARRAAVSIPPSPPGPYNGGVRDTPKEKKSVRDSIRESIRELSS